MSSADAPSGLREAGSLPYPDKPIGSANQQMPFDHVVVVMMENHSFDNLLGDLRRADSAVDGLSFDSAAKATNSNPGGLRTPPEVTAFPLANTAQAKHVSQGWKATHEQINGGAMDGFVRSADSTQPMGYYTPEVLQFAHSLANTFTVANRWFSSVPAPTYPNRRFLLAGTAFGGTVTDPRAILDYPPPHGTILDRLSDRHISWANYFTDLPMTAVIPSSVLKHLDHLHLLGRFFHDCQAGSLPAVSFVDPALGLLSPIASAVASLPSFIKDALKLLGADLENLPTGETEEDPQDMYYGEAWAYKVVDAVLHSPAWSRTLLIYTYDEHGGYYDHVAPPSAVAPDDIPPKLQADDPPGKLRHVRPPCAGRGRFAPLQAGKRQQRRLRSHLDPCHHRAQVEPAGAYPARRQRRDRYGLPRSRQRVATSPSAAFGTV